MSNRLFVSLAALAFGIPGLIAPSTSTAAERPRVMVRTQTQSQTRIPGPTPAPAPAPPAAIPVCGLDGEIGQGRGRITSRGADRGYRGELTWRVSETPEVVLTIVSEFTPHRPAVDRITLSIDPGPATALDTRLTGAFGSIQGGNFTIVRGLPDEGADEGRDRRWFDALASGATLTAAAGPDSAPVTWPADQMESDYNYLLDLLQLVAGWEIAGLCANRTTAG